MPAAIDHAVTSGTFSLDGETFDVDNNVWVVGDKWDCIVIDAPHDLAAIVNLIDHGMSLQEAVEAPRVWTEGPFLEVEHGIPETIRQGLEARGHKLVRMPTVSGGMNGIHFHADGRMTGAACWRADGAAMGMGGGLARQEPHERRAGEAEHDRRREQGEHGEERASVGPVGGEGVAWGRRHGGGGEAPGERGPA